MNWNMGYYDVKLALLTVLCFLCSSVDIVAEDAHVSYNGIGYSIRYISFPTDKYAAVVGPFGMAAFSLVQAEMRDEVKDNNQWIKVTTIGKASFKGCYKLKTVVFPSELETIEEDAFTGCTALTEVNFPETLQSIDNYGFHGCSSLQTLVFPNSLATIGNYAFFECSGLTSVDMASVRSFGKNAFQGCSKLSGDVNFSSRLNTLGMCAFQGCVALRSITFHNVGNNKSSIQRCAFDNCSGIEKVILSNGIFMIGDYAFRNCIGLHEIVTCDGLTKLGMGVFQNCARMKKVVISSTVTEIGDSAFYNCSSLDSVYAYMDTPVAFGSHAFDGISPQCVLIVPCGKREAYIAAGWTEAIFKGGIKELPAPEGIHSVMVRKGESPSYDLQGRIVNNLQKGKLYIKDGRKILKR